MYLGELTLLIVAALVMTGLAKGVTARLKLNNYVASFLIFVIVLLNVRGGVKLNGNYTLSLGGVLSVVTSTYIVIKRSERGSDIFFAVISMLGNAALVFAYSLHFLSSTSLDPKLLSALLSLLAGLWCAFAAKRTFAACLFCAVTGGFVGVTLYLIFFRMSGNIGGSYCFSTMWLSAVFGLTIQYLVSVLMRTTKSTRANSYFEAAELMEEDEQEKKKN